MGSFDDRSAVESVMTESATACESVCSAGSARGTLVACTVEFDAAAFGSELKLHSGELMVPTLSGRHDACRIRSRVDCGRQSLVAPSGAPLTYLYVL
jgi:hypothetical protein